MTRADIMNEAALEALSQEECPICQTVIKMDSICSNCKTDLNEVFVCSNRSDRDEGKKHCNKVNEKCEVRGLDYEVCGIFTGR